VKDMRDRQSQLLHLLENSLMRSTRIDHDGLLRHWIADDRAITAKRRNGECFPNNSGHDRRMLLPKPIKAQAAALPLVRAEAERSKRLPYRITSSSALDGDTIRGTLLRYRLDVGLRHTTAPDRYGGLALRERKPADPEPTTAESVSHEPREPAQMSAATPVPLPPVPNRTVGEKLPALRACLPWRTDS